MGPVVVLRDTLLRSFLLLMFISGFISPAAFGESPVPHKTYFQVIKEYGKYDLLDARKGQSEVVVAAKNGEFGYLVKRIEVRDEDHLIRLMGGASEAGLSDIQKGLLETYRFSKGEGIASLKAYLPSNTGSVNLELTDLTGQENSTTMPTLKNDFWPQNAKVYTFKGQGTPLLEVNIRMSAADCLNSGPQIPAEMKATFAHEYGHSLDQTRKEDDGYGRDNHHYFNEVIGEKAAFVEGFANFVQLTLFPGNARRYRDAIQNIMVETPTSYATLRPNDAQLPAKDLLRVEGVIAMTLNRLAKEIPEGTRKIFAAFVESNSKDNNFSKFLQKFIEKNTEYGDIIAQILDEETRKRLTNQELRDYLGNSYGVDKYLRARVDPTPTTPAKPISAGQPQISSSQPPTPVNDGRPRIYKWKDKEGRIHFTDAPPTDGSPYEARKTMFAPKVGNEGVTPFGN